jgi:hypothetical protein
MKVAILPPYDQALRTAVVVQALVDLFLGLNLDGGQMLAVHVIYSVPLWILYAVLATTYRTPGRWGSGLIASGPLLLAAPMWWLMG